MLYRTETEKAAARLGDSASVSNLKSLYLVSYWESWFKSSDIQALITQPKALESLALYIQDIGDGRGKSTISNDEMWTCLQKHKHSLERIDIYRDGIWHRDENGHFGLLRSFTNLKHLCIQVEMLLGGCCDSPLAPFRLKDTLPSTLQTLVLYGEEGYDIIHDLSLQVQELTSGDFPLLESITMEFQGPVCDLNGHMTPPYQDLKEKCKGKGINFSIGEIDEFRKGGSCPQLWARTLHMTCDGNARDAAATYAPEEIREPEELLLGPPVLLVDDYDSKDEHDPHFQANLRCHIVPFTDHTGKTAYMVFENLESIPLPPLFSFSIYFTFVNATPDHAAMENFYREFAFEYGESGFARFDIYFLPGASHEDCVSHYLGEKAVRGSYMKQVQMFKKCPRDEIHPLPGMDAQLPGIVDRYFLRGQVLYIVSEQHWFETQRLMWSVKFDQAAREEEGLPPFQAERRPVVYAIEHPQAPDPVYDDMDVMVEWDKEMWFWVWQKATSRGWTGW